MRWVELIIGVVLVIAGVACVRGHRELDTWSFRIWVLPSDYEDSEASDRFRLVSTFVICIGFLAGGAGLLVTAIWPSI
jgi:hypothetical protein